MKIENTQVYGFKAAIRAMRNPMNSWARSDSKVGQVISPNDKNYNVEGFVLGEADKALSQKLSKAGTEHRKHLRLIRVWADLTLPRYIHQEMDTYKYIDKISCSTVHTLMKGEISQDNFEYEVPHEFIDMLNAIIHEYKKTDNKEIKRQRLIQCKNLLPEGFLQKRTISTNYECLLAMYYQRHNHRLPEWHKICDWILSLPYFIELTGIENNQKE